MSTQVPRSLTLLLEAAKVLDAQPVPLEGRTIGSELDAAIEVLRGQPAPVSTMFPTNRLRWVQDPRTDAVPPVLQQAWVGRETGTVVWREVETVVGEVAR